MLTHSIRDSKTSIGFVQGPPGSRRERVKNLDHKLIHNEAEIIMQRI